MNDLKSTDNTRPSKKSAGVGVPKPSETQQAKTAATPKAGRRQKNVEAITAAYYQYQSSDDEDVTGTQRSVKRRGSKRPSLSNASIGSNSSSSSRNLSSRRSLHSRSSRNLGNFKSASVRGNIGGTRGVLRRDSSSTTSSRDIRVYERSATGRIRRGSVGSNKSLLEKHISGGTNIGEDDFDCDDAPVIGTQRRFSRRGSAGSVSSIGSEGSMSSVSSLGSVSSSASEISTASNISYRSADVRNRRASLGGPKSLLDTSASADTNSGDDSSCKTSPPVMDSVRPSLNRRGSVGSTSSRASNDGSFRRSRRRSMDYNTSLLSSNIDSEQSSDYNDDVASVSSRSINSVYKSPTAKLLESTPRSASKRKVTGRTYTSPSQKKTPKTPKSSSPKKPKTPVTETKKNRMSAKIKFINLEDDAMDSDPVDTKVSQANEDTVQEQVVSKQQEQLHEKQCQSTSPKKSTTMVPNENRVDGENGATAPLNTVENKKIFEEGRFNMARAPVYTQASISRLSCLVASAAGAKTVEEAAEAAEAATYAAAVAAAAAAAKQESVGCNKNKVGAGDFSRAKGIRIQIKDDVSAQKVSIKENQKQVKQSRWSFRSRQNRKRNSSRNSASGFIVEDDPTTALEDEMTICSQTSSSYSTDPSRYRKSSSKYSSKAKVAVAATAAAAAAAGGTAAGVAGTTGSTAAVAAAAAGGTTMATGAGATTVATAALGTTTLSTGAVGATTVGASAAAGAGVGATAASAAAGAGVGASAAAGAGVGATAAAASAGAGATAAGATAAGATAATGSGAGTAVVATAVTGAGVAAMATVAAAAIGITAAVVVVAAGATAVATVVGSKGERERRNRTAPTTVYDPASGGRRSKRATRSGRVSRSFLRRMFQPRMSSIQKSVEENAVALNQSLVAC